MWLIHVVAGLLAQLFFESSTKPHRKIEFDVQCCVHCERQMESKGKSIIHIAEYCAYFSLNQRNLQRYSVFGRITEESWCDDC